MDKDKKERIDKEQAKRPGVYQSAAHPHHFDNEGGEKITEQANKRDDNNSMGEELDWDKMNGKKDE